MPGPAPSKNARRRNARPDWRQLPPEGRPGPAPKWPLSTRPAHDDVRNALDALWDELWATPQAVAWAELGWTRVVGRYALMVVTTELLADLNTAAMVSEIRQLEDRLGLTPMAMRRLQWEIGEAAPAIKSSEVTSLDSRRRSRAAS